MKKPLESRITEWKNANTGNKEMRTVNFEKSKSGDGEYEIFIKMSISLNNGERMEKVSISKKIKTVGQSGEDPYADVQLFNDTASKLVSEFYVRHDAVQKKLMNRW